MPSHEFSRHVSPGCLADAGGAHQAEDGRTDCGGIQGKTDVGGVQGKTDGGVGDVAMVADNAQGGEQDQSGGPASRPQRATGHDDHDDLHVVLITVCTPLVHLSPASLPQPPPHKRKYSFSLSCALGD